MPHLLFDFNNVILFAKRSIPIDLIMMLQQKVDPQAVEKKLSQIDFDHYFEFNTDLLHFLQEIRNSQTATITIYTNSTFSIAAPKSKKTVATFASSVYQAKVLSKPKDSAASYQFIADQLNAKPPEILFVDDLITNIEAAAKAGLHTHHYTNNQGLFAAIQTFLAQSSTIAA